MTDSPASNRHSGTAEQRILDAAMSAFIKHGYAETSTLEIAKRAKVSKRDIYAAFGSKEQMLMACILERMERLLALPRREVAIRENYLARTGGAALADPAGTRLDWSNPA